MKVLLVEDNPGDRRLVEEMFAENAQDEIALASAGSLFVALSRLAEEHFDVVLLDLSLPDSSGLNTLGAVRTHAPSVPVVLLTGLDDDRICHEALKHGAQDYLLKNTLDARTLLRSLRYACLRQVSAATTVPENVKASSGKLVAILGTKGGVGTTTIAYQTAVVLQQLTKMPLALIDLDFSSSILAHLLTLNPSYSVVDATENLDRLDASYWQGLVSKHNGLQVLLSQGSRSLGTAVAGDRLRPVLRFVKSQYGWSVVDLPRCDAIALEVFPEFDEVCVVVTPELPTLRQGKAIREKLNTLGVPPDHIRILVNRASHEFRFSRDELCKLFDVSHCTFFPESSDVQHAYREGTLEGRNLKPGVIELVSNITGVSSNEATPKGLRSFFRLTN